jgi:hypothetical protein
MAPSRLHWLLDRKYFGTLAILFGCSSGVYVLLVALIHVLGVLRIADRQLQAEFLELSSNFLIALVIVPACLVTVELAIAFVFWPMDVLLSRATAQQRRHDACED